MDKLLYGVAYYDEYMPCDRLAKDVEMMKAAGINLVRIAESTWSTCEPQEGVFDFSHVIRVLDAMEEAGISVIIGTPTYAIPTWMVKSHPDVLATTKKGPGIYGARQIMDITHPVYRYYGERVIRKLMEVSAHRKCVIGFQLDNETKYYDTAGKNVQEQFVKYLRTKFNDDLDAMNQAFGLDYWSNRINAWEDFPDVRGTINGSLGAEFQKFQRTLVDDYLQWQADIVKEYAREDQFITHNFDFDWRGYSYGVQPMVDHKHAARALTVAGVDIYHPTQDELTGALIGLARAVDGNEDLVTEKTDALMIESLFMTLTNVNFDDSRIQAQIDRVHREQGRMIPRCAVCASPCGRNEDYNMEQLWQAEENIRSLKSLLLFGLRGMAAYAYHAMVLGYTDNTVNQFFYEALMQIGLDLTMEELLPEVLKLGEVNLRCMALLDRANTETYGTPEPTKVSMQIDAGPFIVVTGHDLKDLQLLLEQTKDKGIAVYTHGEMLPAHAYPKLKAYPHLKGNFGTAWQNQQKEFDAIPAPVLFTTNCLMPPKPSYADRVFTTEAVGFPEMVHIGKDKDFTPVIEKALELGGYAAPQQQTGINGGTELTTGFGHGAVLSVADKVVNAVKAGKIRHFFLVGGCDGAKAGRNYYTEFVKQTPPDTIVLTLACGKYRFHDLDLGTIDGLPRIMDMGQCNDAYSAIQVAVALAEAFGCGVNELPLSYVLSWYEQKAVCILLTLLHLGIRNIRLGPSLPAFLSPDVLQYLVDSYGIAPITTPEQDLAELLQ